MENNGHKTVYSERITTKRNPLLALGVRGLKNLAGYVNEEYLSMLQSWDKEAKNYLEMRDDCIIATMLDAIKLPLLKAPITVESVSEGLEDKLAAEFLEKNIHNMNQQLWLDHVQDMLECVEFGFAIAEITLEKRTDGHIWIKNLDPRGQETLYKWGFGEGSERDTTKIFYQRDPDSGEIMEIPLEKCVHVTMRGRKGNPQGHALLRSLFRPWRMCRDLENLEAIGVERDVGGMPVAKLPEGNISDSDMTDLRNALKSLRIDEASFLVLPFGVDVGPYGSGNKTYDVSVIIERLQKMILGRAFAQFLKLGMDNVGTQALVKGSQAFFQLHLGAVQQAILPAWNQQLIPYLFQYNHFPGISGYPKLAWADPGQIDINNIVQALEKAAGIKIFTPTDTDEDNLRELMNWPELPESERGIPREPEKPSLLDIIKTGTK